MPKGISLNACSKALGYSISTLHKHRKNGAFKPLKDGTYDLEAVRNGLLQWTVPNAKHKAKLSPERKVRAKLDLIDDDTLTDIKKLLASEGFDLSGGLTLELVKAAEGIARAHERMFNLAIKRKEWIPLKPAAEHTRNIFIGFRKMMENIPARHADNIAAELGCDAHTLEHAMLRVIKETLNEMAAPIVRDSY